MYDEVMDFTKLIQQEVQRNEGFWRKNADGSYDMHNFSIDCMYPYPEPQDTNIGAEFITKLEQLEDSIRKKEKGLMYCVKSSPKCLLCQQRLGSMRYEYQGFTWQQTYKHYLQEHNVHPSPEFKKMVDANE